MKDNRERRAAVSDNAVRARRGAVRPHREELEVEREGVGEVPAADPVGSGVPAQVQHRAQVGRFK